MGRLTDLVDRDLLVARSVLPRGVHALLSEARRRIARFRLGHRIPAFVPSDFRAAYALLRALASVPGAVRHNDTRQRTRMKTKK